jgi:hypothetical protein
LEKLQDMVKQKVQDELKQYQDTTNKKTWEDTKTSKWTQRGLQQTPKWNKGDYKKEIYEIKKTTKDMKEEFNKDKENLRKKNQTETLLSSLKSNK